MSTNPAHDQLSAYLDGELEDAEAAAVEAALESDSDLQAELDQLRSVQRLLRSHGPVRAPEGFHARVMSAARSEDKVVAFPWWRRPFGIPVEGVLVAAAAALVLIVALPKAEPPATGPESETEVSPAAPAPTKSAEPEKSDGLADANNGVDSEQLGAKGQGYGSGGLAAGGVGTADDQDGATSTGKTAPTKGDPKGAPKPAPTAAPEQGGTADGGSTDNAALPAPTKGSQGTDVEDPQMAASGLMVQLYTDQEDVLGTLQAIAARHGGVIRDSANKVVTTGLLDAGETRIWIDVSGSQVSALNKELEALGATIETTNPTITAGNSLKVPVRIVVTASGPSEPTDAPNAARKSRQMDEASYDSVDQ